MLKVRRNADRSQEAGPSSRSMSTSKSMSPDCGQSSDSQSSQLRPPRRRLVTPSSSPSSAISGKGKGKEREIAQEPSMAQGNEDAAYHEAIESLAQSRQWLMEAVQRRSIDRKARIQLRRRLATEAKRNQAAAKAAVEQALGASPKAAAVKSNRGSNVGGTEQSPRRIPSPPKKRSPQEPAQSQAQSQAQSSPAYTSQQQPQSTPSPAPSPSPSYASQASQGTLSASGSLPAQGSPSAAVSVASDTPVFLDPASTASVYSSASSASVTSTSSSIVSMSSASTSVFASSTSLPSFSSSSSAAPSASSSVPAAPSVGLQHNVPLILVISVGSAIMFATIIGALSWLFRFSNSKSRVNKRKRLGRGNWSPGAGSSIFSLTGEKAIAGGQSIRSPMPALTGFSDPRGKDTMPIAHMESIPNGRGWTLFDNPMPRRGSGAPSAQSIHQVYTGADGSFAIGNGTGVEHGPRLVFGNGDEDLDMRDVWPPNTHRASLVERMWKGNHEEGLPLQNEKFGAAADSAPFSSQPVLLSNATTSRSSTRRSSQGVFSTLSSSFLKATGLKRRELISHAASAPAGISDFGQTGTVALGRTDSQLPCARRLTKRDERFRCDESTSEEESRASPPSEHSTALAPPPMLGRSPAVSTPGMAGIGSAFTTVPSHLANPFIGMVQIPRPAALFGAEPARFSTGLQLASFQQLRQQQDLLAAQSKASNVRDRLEASIALWQAATQAGSPSLNTLSRKSTTSASSTSGSMRRLAHMLNSRSMTSASATTLYSPVTSISEYSTVSSRGKAVKEALDMRKAAVEKNIAPSTMVDWLAAEQQAMSSSEEGSAICFDGSHAVNSGKGQTMAMSKGTRMTPLRSSTHEVVIPTSRRSTTKSVGMSSATASTRQPSLFDEMSASELKAAKRRNRKSAARASRTAGSQVTPLITQDTDLGLLADQIESMLADYRLLQEEEEVEKAQSGKQVVARPFAQEGVSPLTSSDSDISTRRWNAVPLYPMPVDQYTGKRRKSSQQVRPKQRYAAPPTALAPAARLPSSTMRVSEGGRKRSATGDFSGSAALDILGKKHLQHRSAGAAVKRSLGAGPRRIVSTPPTLPSVEGSSAESSPALLAYLDKRRASMATTTTTASSSGRKRRY